MEYDVFISYSRKDSDIANRIYEALSAEGIKCFIDMEGISGGADFPAVLADAIMGSKVLLLVASENSYASDFTQKELTFAVSNKGSRFIFPLIIDKSSLPKSLEFMLSDINWRTLSTSYTIEKNLVADIKRKLANPHAGETVKQKERHTVKVMMYIVIAIVAIAFAIVLSQSYQQKKVQDRQAAEAQAARSAHKDCLDWGLAAEALYSEADSLQGLGMPFQTLEEVVVRLDRIDSMTSSVDSVKNAYRLTSYNSMFLDISTSGIKEKSALMRDEIFTFWNYYAHINYEEYIDYPEEENRLAAINYIDKALLVKPDDADLLEMKETLSK